MENQAKGKMMPSSQGQDPFKTNMDGFRLLLTIIAWVSLDSVLTFLGLSFLICIVGEIRVPTLTGVKRITYLTQYLPHDYQSMKVSYKTRLKAQF